MAICAEQDAEAWKSQNCRRISPKLWLVRSSRVARKGNVRRSLKPINWKQSVEHQQLAKAGAYWLCKQTATWLPMGACELRRYWQSACLAGHIPLHVSRKVVVRTSFFEVFKSRISVDRQSRLFQRFLNLPLMQSKPYQPDREPWKSHTNWTAGFCGSRN